MDNVKSLLLEVFPKGLLLTGMASGGTLYLNLWCGTLYLNLFSVYNSVRVTDKLRKVMLKTLNNPKLMKIVSFINAIYFEPPRDHH